MKFVLKNGRSFRFEDLDRNHAFRMVQGDGYDVWAQTMEHAYHLGHFKDKIDAEKLIVSIVKAAGYGMKEYRVS